MRLELVVVGMSGDRQAEWTGLAGQDNVTLSFFPDIKAASQHTCDAIEVLVLPFENVAGFRNATHVWRSSGRQGPVIAYLAQIDYGLCRDAFRAGADDVIAEPLTLAEFQAALGSIRSAMAMRVHPDAILPLEAVERNAIKVALLACNGQVSKTSRKLGIGRSTLYRKLDQYNLINR